MLCCADIVFIVYDKSVCTDGFSVTIIHLLLILQLMFVYTLGWESQLLETGFLAIFLCPVLKLCQVPEHTPTSWVVVFGYRWLLFRIMFGAVSILFKLLQFDCLLPVVASEDPWNQYLFEKHALAPSMVYFQQP